MSGNEDHKDLIHESDTGNTQPLPAESELLKQLLDGVYELTAPPDNHKAANVFHALPERRLTAYYKIIKRPFSLYRIKQKISQKKYANVADFIYDFAQITYNARVFNRKNSIIYSDALILDKYLREVVIEKLRATGNYSDEQLSYPEIGPLPEGSDNDEYFEEIPVLAASGGHDDYDEDDDDEDDYDEDDEGLGKSRRRSGKPRRSVILGQRRKREEEEEESRQAASLDNERKSKRRGRPPIVDKPHEHRIKNIIRVVRKERDEVTGRLLIIPFEKLPDGKLYPNYYTEIEHPISLDQIRKNIKGRKYFDVDSFINDMNLMFENAKEFNAPGSEIYEDAVILQKVMQYVADEEKKKPDSVYQDLESSHARTSRLPLDEVEHRGEIYKVGDWVHLSNPNDPAKPIIGQIFRVWQVSDGQKWVNVCWYLRPEQTVHRVDRVFYENEVFKSGQYRDHLIDEILEKCFIMFVSKYIRGRPVGIGPHTMVYCCENRYNEQEKSFNRIRTWKACLPDEVRHMDYDMDLFERPLHLRRIASPIKHLLPENAKDDDPIPEPKMGADKAPPIVGAVYKRPVDPKDPLEQPTPDGTGDEVGNAGQSRPLARKTSGPIHNVSLVVPPTTANTRFAPPMGPASVAAAAMTPKGSPFVTRIQGTGSTPSFTPNALPSYPVTPGGIPPITPSSYTFPDVVQRLLPEEQLHGVAKQTKTDQMLWFASTPLWIPQRHVTHHVRKELMYNFRLSGSGYDVNEDGEQEVPGSRSTIGHSAKYLAYRLNKDKQ